MTRSCRRPCWVRPRQAGRSFAGEDARRRRSNFEGHETTLELPAVVAHGSLLALLAIRRPEAIDLSRKVHCAEG